MTTTLSYVEDRKVSEVRTSSSGYSDIVVDYDPASVVGVNGSGTFAPAVVGEVSALIDGPRPSSVGDTTRLFVTGWGAVRGTRDALGNETWIHYEDASYPGLPTRVRHPNGWEVTASYHSNGLLDEVTDRSNGAVTAYEWNTTWSQPTKITSPEGVVTEFSYNGSGDRTKRKVGADSVLYAYNGDGQVTKITDGEGNETTLAYDSDGNLESEAGPTSIGSWTHYSRDGRGYPTHTGQATGTASDSTIVTKAFDEVGRVTESLQETSADDMWLRTTHTYDTATGLKTQTEAWGGATANDSTTTGTTEWDYDPFGRVTIETSPARADTMVYDLAGNVLEKISNGDTIAMAYDALGRLESRDIPGKSFPYDTLNYGWKFPAYETSGLSLSADTEEFTYDAMGNTLTADNKFAEVTRTYYLNGALKTDQQAIKEYDSSSFATHVYDLSFDYDLDGRRTAVHHPAWLSTGSDQTTYSYDADGRLSTVTDALGEEYGFTYNSNGQVTTGTFPGGSTSMGWDEGGRLDSLAIVADGSSLLNEGLTHDKRGKITYVGSGGGYSDMSYNGFGHVTEALVLAQWGQTGEYFERDAFGNATSRHTWPPGETPEAVPGTKFLNNHSSYQGGRMASSQQDWDFEKPSDGSDPNYWNPGFQQNTYDDWGQLTDNWSEKYSWTYSGGEGYENADKVTTYRSRSQSYYAADGKLRVHQIMRDSVDYRSEPTLYYGNPWGAYEEYWYDALGRRVLKRSRQSSPVCTYSGRCHSSITRFVWDGNQILWEVRQADGSNKDIQNPSGGAQAGNIGYVHAGGIDAPLGMVRNGSTVALHRNWRGLYAFATDENGDQLTCAPQSFSGCDDVSWPGGTWNLQRGHIDPHATQTWYGSVSMGHQDRTGLLYQRNRYYDSSTGQFTRQDPIGIAGGLNLYGYANGDPVNFHDPFGLDCEERDEPGTQAMSKECDEDGVVIVGIQGSAVFGVGPVGSVGVVIDGADSGLYGRIGIHFGLNTSIGGETGAMDEEALTGATLEMCAGGATGDACVLLAPTEDGGLNGGFGAGGGGPALGISPVTVDAGGSVGGRLSFTRLMNGLRKIFTPPDCPTRLQRCGGW